MALPRHFVTGMLVFSIFIVAGMFLVIDFGVNNAKTEEFNDTFNVVNDITTQANNISQSITEAETDFGAFGVLNSLINSAWTGLGILFNTVRLAGNVFSDTATFLKVPSGVLAIVALITAICTIFISFAIWSAIFQREL